MNKTAEEILNEFEPNREYPNYYHETNVLEAMHQFAQSQSIAFAEWVIKNGWSFVEDLGKYVKIGMRKSYTTSKLFQLFLTDKNK